MTLEKANKAIYEPSLNRCKALRGAGYYHYRYSNKKYRRTALRKRETAETYLF